MNYNETILAKKYATAFFNCYGAQFSTIDYNALASSALYLKHNATFFFLLDTPRIPHDKKLTTITTIMASLSVPDIIEKLIILLIEHRRVALLPTIFKQLIHLYEVKNKIVSFAIESSHQLSDEQLIELKKFLSKKINASILYTYMINKKLIAGIRMQSNTFLWEYSIAKQLKAVKRTILNSKGY